MQPDVRDVVGAPATEARLDQSLAHSSCFSRRERRARRTTSTGDRTMQRNWMRAVTAGLVGTGVMTAFGLWVAPMTGIPRMNPAEMLAGVMGGRATLGW